MPASNTDSIRILIVDDHPVMCSGLSNMLNAQHGMEVITSAGSGAEALTLIAREKPDVVLLDLRMPGMDGIAVLQALRFTANGPKIVVLTSYEQDELIYK